MDLNRKFYSGSSMNVENEELRLVKPGITLKSILPGKKQKKRWLLVMSDFNETWKHRGGFNTGGDRIQASEKYQNNRLIK